MNCCCTRHNHPIYITNSFVNFCKCICLKCYQLTSLFQRCDFGKVSSLLVVVDFQFSDSLDFNVLCNKANSHIASLLTIIAWVTCSPNGQQSSSGMSDATNCNWLYLSHVWQRVVCVIMVVTASLYAGSSRRVHTIPPSQVLTEGTWLLSFSVSLVIMSVSLSLSEQEGTPRRWCIDRFIFGNLFVETNVCGSHIVKCHGTLVVVPRCVVVVEHVTEQHRCKRRCRQQEPQYHFQIYIHLPSQPTPRKARNRSTPIFRIWSEVIFIIRR